MTEHRCPPFHEGNPEQFKPFLRESEPGFTDWAAWPLPIVYNHRLAPTFEWCMSEDGVTAQFRMVDAFGSVIFGVSIAWPWTARMVLDETGRLNEQQ